MNNSSQKMNMGKNKYKNSKKIKNKNRAYASNRNIIKINIHCPRNRRKNKTIEPIKMQSIKETPRSMVFTNVINPRSAVNRKSEYAKTHVGKGASIGANANNNWGWG